MVSATRRRVAFWAIVFSFAAAAIEVGGGLYEHLLVDRVFPHNLPLIQPQHGGIDRKLFWMPAHFLMMVALPLALWASWRDRAARRSLLWAIGLYGVVRAWSGLYFIPLAMAFEEAATVTPELAATMGMWTLLSVTRTAMMGAVAVFLFRAFAVPRPVGAPPAARAAALGGDGTNAPAAAR